MDDGFKLRAWREEIFCMNKACNGKRSKTVNYIYKKQEGVLDVIMNFEITFDP